MEKEDQQETPKSSRRMAGVSLTKQAGVESFGKSGKIDAKMKSNIAKYSDALNAIKMEQGEPADKIEKFRVSCKKYMSDSTFGYIFELVNVGITALSTAHCIYLTYLHKGNPAHEKPLQAAAVFGLFFSIFFACDWLFELFLADHKYPYLFSFSSVVDVITVISTLLTLPHNPPHMYHYSSGHVVVMYIVYGFKYVRILRALRAGKQFILIEDAITRYIAQVSLNGIVFLLFFAAVMQYLETSFSPFGFHTWLYYIWVTIATVGYGDISPHSTPGRMAAIVMIGFAIISVPKATNELIAKMKLQSVYMRASYVPRSRSSKHVIICGDLSSTTLRNFFEELFHEDHDSSDLSAVMLLPMPPTVEIILLMREPKYSLSLVYLEGSALVESDLRRAKAESARSIFIMTNKFASNPDEEDAKSILLNLSIKRYLSYYERVDMLYCTQLIRPENRRHLSKNDANELDENDLVVCLNEIKMGAMAKAVVCPGANTLIMNLVTSFSDSGLKEGEEGRGGGAQEHKATKWIDEYQKGCDWEIYTTPLSNLFENANFTELSYALYEKIGVVLFALEVSDKSDFSKPRILLNPAEFTIPSQKEFNIKAFVIAKNQASSDLSFSDLEEEVSLSNTFTRLQRNIGTIVQTHAKQYQDVIAHRRISLMALAGLGKKAGDETATHEKASEKRVSKWQALIKRSNDSEKMLKAQSYQEVLTQLEDEHFMQNYYASPIPAQLHEVTVKNSVFEEVPFINQHLIILGKGFRNLYDFIRPLRAKYLPLRYIVLLYPDIIPHNIWQRISIFEAILVVRGSPLEESSLRRAGIFRAAQVVVLANGAAGSSGSVGMEALADSDSIFAYHLVKRMNPNAQMLVEVVNQSNVAYIHEDVEDGMLDVTQENAPRFAPSFAAGNLFTTSFLDSIVCQSYYNPLITKVITELISGVDRAEKSDLFVDAAEIMAQDISAKEEATASSPGKPEPLISSKMRNSIFKLQQKGKSRLASIKSSYLYQIPLPPDLEVKTYGALYQHLVKQGMIPLGILRGTFSILTLGPLSNRLPYVFANPPNDTELFLCDKIFVLSLKPVGVNAHQGIKAVVADIKAQRGRARTSSEESLSGTRLLNSRPHSGGRSRTSRPGSASKYAENSPDEMNAMLSNIVNLMGQTLKSAPSTIQATPLSSRGRKTIKPSTPAVVTEEKSAETPQAAAEKNTLLKVVGFMKR